MKNKPKNIPSPYKSAGTPIYRDTTALPFDEGGIIKPIPANNIGEKILKRYPGMQSVYGATGENLNVIQDPNYLPSNSGIPYGSIEFIFPGTEVINYSDTYKYQNPTPDKYTTVFNPKGANKHDVFLDMTHGMRNDPEYMKLLDKFAEESKKARGASMDKWYNYDVENYNYQDPREEWDNNYIDGLLRAHLAKKGMGRHSFGAKDYRKERKGSSPEMYKAADNIYNYLKGNKLLDGGPLVDKTNHGDLLPSVYASALGNYYAQGGMIKRADGSYSPRGLWDNIRAAAAKNRAAGKPGKEPSQKILSQAKKIEAEEKQLGGYLYGKGGQFPTPYSLPEDSFKQGGNNLHNSVYASSMAQYPAVYKYGGSFDMPRQQMYMPLDNVERYGGQMYREGGSVFYATNTPQLEGEGKDLTYPNGAYVYDGGGNIRISPFSYHGDTPGLYRFSTHNPTFNINYSQPFGERIAKEQGFESFTGGLTARLPYKPNTRIGVEGNLRAVGRPNRSSTMTVETDLSGGWDPNVGPYANFIASPQFMFGNVSPTKSKVYGTGLHGGEYLGKVGPFLGASFTPRPQAFTEHINTTTGGAGAVKSTPQAGGMPFGVKGSIDFGLGRKGIRAGLSGYLGADLMGMGLKRSDDQLEGPDVRQGGLGIRPNAGVQANVIIPLKSAKNYIKNIIDEKKAADLELQDSNPRYASAPKFKNGGVIRTSHLFADGGPINPVNAQLAQFLNPEFQKVVQGQEVTVRPTPYEVQQVKNKTEKYNALNIKSEAAESTKPNIFQVDKNIIEKAIAQKAAERKIVAKKIKNSPMLTEEQKAEILMNPQKLDENVHLAYQKEPETLKAAKEYSTMDKIENVLRNPLVATTYFMQPGDFNMPMNYSEFERSPEYSDPLWEQNAVGQGLNTASYFTGPGLALHAADNAIYTMDDLNKAIESGKSEDWEQAGFSAANTGLDLIGSRYIGNSGRLLNAGERATINAMNTSNRLGLNPSVNNYLGTRVFPNISSQVVRSADDITVTRLLPQINPNSINYNPLSRKLYNQAVTVGNAQNTLESTKDLGILKHDVDFNLDIVYKESSSGKIIPFNNKTGKSLQEEYTEELKEYYDSPEFKRIMKEEYPDVNIEQYKKVTLENLKNELEYNPSQVPEGASGVYTSKNSSNAAYMPGHTPTFRQRVANANSNPYMYQGDRGTSQINNPVAAWHELSHQRTNSDELLPDWFTRSFLEENAGIDASNLEYYGRPTEFDVRMKQLKKDLKAQGIHDYFKGPVTEEHIRQLDAANLKEHGDFLFRNMTDEYRKLKKSGASLEELDAVKDKFYTDIENLEKKVGALKTSQDTQDLLQRWDTEFLAKMAKKLPVVVGGAYLGNEFLQNNGLDQRPSGQFKMGGQTRVVKSSQLFNR